MPYTPTNWLDGTAPGIAAGALNNMEDGIRQQLYVQKTSTYVGNTAQTTIATINSAYFIKSALMYLYSGASQAGDVVALEVGGSVAYMFSLSSNSKYQVNYTFETVGSVTSLKVTVPPELDGYYYNTLIFYTEV